jgi:hypothetical protein
MAGLMRPGPAVWILASIASELDERSFFDHMMAIVEPFDGEVSEVDVGLDRDEEVAWFDARLDALEGRAAPLARRRLQ